MATLRKNAALATIDKAGNPLEAAEALFEHEPEPEALMPAEQAVMMTLAELGEDSAGYKVKVYRVSYEKGSKDAWIDDFETSTFASVINTAAVIFV